MKFVVTGNIGCGKSTAVKFLQEFLPDYELFDYDQMVADLYRDEIVQMQLRRAFGTIVKEEISDIVHGDDWQLRQLRSILDEHILENIQAAFKKLNVILDIPLYFEYIEPAIDPRFAPEQILCICANEETQIERVKQRNGWSEEKIKSVMAKQWTQREKCERANYLIMNTGTLEQLKNAIETYTKSIPV